MIDSGTVTIGVMNRAIREFCGGALANLALSVVQTDFADAELEDVLFWVDCESFTYSEGLVGHTAACTMPVLRAKDCRGLHSKMVDFLDYSILRLGEDGPIPGLHATDRAFLTGLHDRFLVSPR